jgi:subtilisin family serine protease
MRPIGVLLLTVLLSCALPPGSTAAHGSATAARNPVVIGYASEPALRTALTRLPGVVLRRVPALRVAEVLPVAERFESSVRALPGIRFVQRLRARRSAIEPALVLPPGLSAPYEWQFQATHADAVPTAVLRAAGDVTIAVIDTGADLRAPDLAFKAARMYNAHTGTDDVRDTSGHGTFVASLAAGSATNGEGIAGFGGNARLLVVKASAADGTVSDFDEARAIVYAVDHGARVINLSMGGPDTSASERRAIEYAAARGVLLVASVGNEYLEGDPVEYPAALLQPVGSEGRGGSGLSVGASTMSGERAIFSDTGTHLSLVAPGEHVFGAVSSLASGAFSRVPLPGSRTGLYGFASGTSFAAPEVAGAAALVIAANPLLRADEVAQILKESASGGGAWTPTLGYGVLDVGSAVARALGRPSIRLTGARSRSRLLLKWSASGAARFRLSVAVNGTSRVLLASTARTSETFDLRRGQRYVFTLTALDETGADAASSSFTLRG